ncbi:Glycosyl hydrolase family 47 protein [Trifolium repens]|nr:Glycosyl hydrolase family 47 protein [Trifolium repens]
MLFVALIYIVFSSSLDWNLESFSATLEFFLGGLVSAHLLASDSSKKLIQGSYKNQLLGLAEDLGIRFLPAFNTPYAWINLKYGVMENETTETSTSGCGERSSLVF